MIAESLFTEEEQIHIQHAFEHLILSCGLWANDREVLQIEKAFALAYEAHGFTRRKSGEPYILHPLAVAQIVVEEIGIRDKTTIIAALLHDVVEDTNYTREDIQSMFGETVAKIVDGLTKISEVIEPNSTQQAETFRKMLLTMSDDIRVALIKIGDRLHNMRTIDHMSQSSQLKIASETIYLYAPLAHRLGLFSIKSELDDHALRVTEPDKFKEIEDKLIDSKSERDAFIRSFILPIATRMDEAGIKCNISGRVKSISSIYEKMKRQKVEFEEIYDIFAIRIVIDPQEIEDDKSLCWQAYSLLTKLYRIQSDRIRDWLSEPKASGYEALHATFYSPSGKWVEVQIRSKRMDEAAEKGVAAHWKYKEDNVQTNERFELWLSRIREVLENQLLKGINFVAEIKSNLVSEQIYVYTPKGEAKIMPVGATALDFAYEIHTELGNHCIGARVNNYVSEPSSYVLKNGDRVEIITSDNHIHSINSLKFVKTHKAKSRINDLLKVNRAAMIRIGKRAFGLFAKKHNLTIDHVFVQEFMALGGIIDQQDLYFQIGAKKIDSRNLEEFIEEKSQLMQDLKKFSEVQSQDTLKQIIQRTRGVDADTLVLGAKMERMTTRIATCCRPIQGDDIVGFVADDGIVIHRTSCSNAIELMAYDGSKIIRAKWDENQHVEYLAAIRMTGQDRKGMLNDIVKVITDGLKIDIRSITIDSFDGYYDGLFKLYVHNTKELNLLIKQLKTIKGVFTAERIDM